jgi:hypothetical protein
MAVTLAQETLMHAVYFAPRGRKRLLNLGYQLSQRYLSPLDKLIGFIGDAGSGKSLLIKGMFPGLELTNDDEGINVRPLPLLKNIDRGFFTSYTYHVDIRFEMAFTQIHVLADAIKQAIAQDKRVVVEHFDLIYPYLDMNAEILIGIGEEVIVTRPKIFGPKPQDIADIVYKTIRYRRMAHSAEDITCKILEYDYGFTHPQMHGDVRHGFVLTFNVRPQVDLYELEARVKQYIDEGIEISCLDDNHIQFGNGDIYHCSGSRNHVRNASEIENFRLVKEYLHDPISKTYSLVGLVGEDTKNNMEVLR